jgi:predicted DCC family thiol-disulfide oxidoreductase YuxK
LGWDVIDCPLVLYDGVCALCNATVTFVLKRDRARVVRFAPLQGETAKALQAAHPEISGVDSIVWIDAAGRAFTRSAAALAIGRYLGGGWAVLATIAVYDLVARWRYRVFGRYDACPVPPPEHRARFLP